MGKNPIDWEKIHDDSLKNENPIFQPLKLESGNFLSKSGIGKSSTLSTIRPKSGDEVKIRTNGRPYEIKAINGVITIKIK